MKEQLLEKIQELYTFYVDYNTIFHQEEAKSRTVKDNIVSKNSMPTPEELEKTIVTLSVDLVMMAQDLQLIYTRLGHYIDIYIELFQEGLPAELQEFYTNYKIVFPHLIFMIKDGNLIEKEEGTLEKRRRAFMEGEYFKKLTEALS